MNSFFPLFSNVTRTAPSFHNPGHIRLWNDTPLRNFEPHLFMAILILLLVAGIGYFIYFKRKAKLNQTVNEQDDDEFLELTSKKNLLLKKIVQLEEAYEAGELSLEEFNKKNTAYKNYLYKVKQELNKFLE